LVWNFHSNMDILPKFCDLIRKGELYLYFPV
jgi:hypothetical protein